MLEFLGKIIIFPHKLLHNHSTGCGHHSLPSEWKFPLQLIAPYTQVNPRAFSLHTNHSSWISCDIPVENFGLLIWAIF